MPVYRPKGKSPYWHFDFRHEGHRFHGSTKTANRREAEAIERQERDKAKREVAASKAARTSLRLDDVAGRYWQEVGQHHAGEGASNTWRQLGRLIAFFGPDKLLTEITDGEVAELVARRRGERNAAGKPLSPFTVNDTLEQLQSSSPALGSLGASASTRCRTGGRTSSLSRKSASGSLSTTKASGWKRRHERITCRCSGSRTRPG